MGLPPVIEPHQDWQIGQSYQSGLFLELSGVICAVTNGSGILDDALEMNVISLVLLKAPNTSYLILL